MNIDQVVPGLNRLTDNERKAIAEFTIAWTLFEAQVLNSAASPAALLAKCEEWRDEGRIAEDEIEPHVAYFRERYFENGQPTHHFDHLHLRGNDHPGTVRDVLSGARNELHLRLFVCLMVVYRYRNNFFHGIKWAYGVKGQEQNFLHSKNLLLWCVQTETGI